MPMLESPPGANVVIDGREYLYFAGTGYLGLQGHPEVIRAACEALRQYGIGTATSRNRVGATTPLLEVESLAAQWFGMDDAFYFPSGYMSPAVVLSLLHDQFDVVLIDELSHYCLDEAALRLGCPILRFAHCDADALRTTLEEQAQATRRALVMTDGVFSVLGRVPPLADYWRLLQDLPGSMLLVDDAHGYGVVGEHGRGALEHAGLWGEEVNSRLPAGDDDRPALWTCGTLSKALGGFGGIVPGSSEAVTRLRSESPYAYAASAPAIPVAAATAKALQIVLDQPEILASLRRNVTHLRTGLRNLGLEIDESPAAVVAIELEKASEMRHVQETLADRGIWIAYVPSYSGVGPEGLLRLAVFATHTPEMIDHLLTELGAILR